MKVNLSGNQTYTVKLKHSPNLKVNTQEAIVSNNFTELSDVNISNLNNTKNNYVVVYDNNLGKFTLVDPDVVLNAAAESGTTQPGLVGYASTFLDRLDVDLDDRIDLDGGSF